MLHGYMTWLLAPSFPAGLDESFTLALDDYLGPLYECNAGNCPAPNMTFMDWTDRIPFPVTTMSVTLLGLLNVALGISLDLNLDIEVCYAKAC
jgi:hypothetical protein